MKIIITESKLKFLRRLPIIDKLISSSMDVFFNFDKPKIDFEHLFNFLLTDVAEQYFFRYFEDEYVSGDVYDELQNFLETYLKMNWSDRIEAEIKKHKGQ